jgi:hypothetical protein
MVSKIYGQNAKMAIITPISANISSFSINYFLRKNPSLGTKSFGKDGK